MASVSSRALSWLQGVRSVVRGLVGPSLKQRRIYLVGSSGVMETVKLVVVEAFLSVLVAVGGRNMIQLWRGDPRMVRWFDKSFRAGNWFHRRWLSSLAPGLVGGVFMILDGLFYELIGSPIADAIFLVLFFSFLAAFLMSCSVFIWGRPQWAIPPHVRSLLRDTASPPRRGRRAARSGMDELRPTKSGQEADPDV